MGLGLVKVRLKVRFKVSIGGRVRVSFFGSFRVRVRGGVMVRFWLGPGTRLDPRLNRHLSKADTWSWSMPYFSHLLHLPPRWTPL